jgi:hypothetical protein
MRVAFPLVILAACGVPDRDPAGVGAPPAVPPSAADALVTTTPPDIFGLMP